jgi:hypothetical protein
MRISNEMMIDKVKGLKRFMTASMPITKEDFENQGKVIGYNEAIEDVIKLFSIPVVMGSFNCLEQNIKGDNFKCGEHYGKCVK